MSEPVYLGVAVAGVVVFAAPVIMLAHQLPNRSGAWWRRSLAALVSLAIAAAMSLTTTPMSYGVREAAAFVLEVVVAAGAVSLCKECRPWMAFFCAAAGYVIQNLGATFSDILGLALEGLAGSVPSEVTVSLILIGSPGSCVLCYVVFIRRMRLDKGDEDASVLTFALVLVVILVNIGADAATQSMVEEGMSMAQRLVLLAAHAVTCLLTLFLVFELMVNRRLVADVAVTHHMMEERSNQYAASREAVEAVDARMHDIRHALARTLADGATDNTLDRSTLADAVRNVELYDAHLRTGNKALDVALTQKRLVCVQGGITLSCVADGSCLSSLPPEDVYAVFCSLLDVAIADERLLDKERAIAVVVRRAGGAASIHVEWRCLARHDFAIPQQAKAIVREHGGALTHGFQGSSLYVNALIPQA